MSPITKKRRLVVNADDFGLTKQVNEGILAAHRRGIVRSASLMANGIAFDHAVESARQTPSLDIGCHLVLTGGGCAMSERGSRLPGSVLELIVHMLTGKIHVAEEMSAQVERALAAGMHISHADTHKGAHIMPPVMDALVRVAARYRIPWIRMPFDYGWSRERIWWRRRLAYRAARAFQGKLKRRVDRYGRRTTDYFTGLHMIGRFDAADLARLFRELPPGTTELMCHPGFVSQELFASGARLTSGRERELAALTAPETHAAATENGIELVSYREI